MDNYLQLVERARNRDAQAFAALYAQVYQDLYRFALYTPVSYTHLDVYKRQGGIPYPHYEEPEIQREVLLHATKEQMELMAAADALQMGKMDCFIGVRGSCLLYTSRCV